VHSFLEAVAAAALGRIKVVHMGVVAALTGLLDQPQIVLIKFGEFVDEVRPFSFVFIGGCGRQVQLGDKGGWVPLEVLPMQRTHPIGMVAIHLLHQTGFFESLSGLLTSDLHGLVLLVNVVHLPHRVHPILILVLLRKDVFLHRVRALGAASEGSSAKS